MYEIRSLIRINSYGFSEFIQIRDGIEKALSEGKTLPEGQPATLYEALVKYVQWGCAALFRLVQSIFQYSTSRR